MPDIYTVAQVTSYLVGLIESDPLLSDLWVRGEVSNWHQARSGHCYFTLKDEGAELRCVMWRGAAERLDLLPRDGDDVVAAGHFSVYAERGQYQFYVNEMQPLGTGVLYRRFEALKRTLEAEGLFDAPPRPLPPFPRRIGIVTSPGAAALQDILNVLRRRYPLVEVVLAPTRVQGSEAPGEIARALGWIGRSGVDLVIVARGGGSLEDLWAFNEEVVARAMFACALPLISGVGHEVDFTIADFVADHRAPTPSAAAELAVPDRATLRINLAAARAALDGALALRLAVRRDDVAQEQRALERLSPQRRIAVERQRLDDLARRLDRAPLSRLGLQRSRLDGLRGRLAGLEPRATLARGYASVADAESGRLIRTAAAVQGGQRLRITLSDGEIEATAGRNGATEGVEDGE